MVKKIFYIFIIIILFFSCNKYDYSEKKLIKNIIQHPKSIKEITSNSQIEISTLLKESIQNDKFDSLYTNHFIQYDGNYRIKKILKNKTDDNAIIKSIWIMNIEKQIMTEFQFIRKNKNLILHNIVIIPEY
jgi:uncharacterized membrane protein YvbJ